MICLGDSLPISANDKVRERVDEYLLFSAFRDILFYLVNKLKIISFNLDKLFSFVYNYISRLFLMMFM